MGHLFKKKNLLSVFLLFFAISFFAFINFKGAFATTSVVENIISDELTYLGNNSYPGGFKSFNGSLYFSATNATYGTELWKTDGTNTTLVDDINSGNASAFYSEPELVELSSWLYFPADDGINGTEIWRINGATTEMVHNIKSGSGSSYPFGLAVFDGYVYFAADDSTHGVELWRTNGASTSLVNDINVGTSSAFTYGLELVELSSWLYFAADDGVNGKELWRTNGVTTEIVSNINSGSADSNPSGLTVLGSWIYFSADTSVSGTELWRTNGVTTEIVSNINSGVADSNPADFKVFSGWLYFTASNGTNGTEPWRTNGVTTEMVRDVKTGSGNSVLSGSGMTFTGFVQFGSWLYFPADDGIHGFEPWRTNGTTTELAIDLNLGKTSSMEPYYSDSLKFVENNSWLYFAAKATSSNLALWRTNGTTTEEVSSSSLNSSNGSEVHDITAYNNMVYFGMRSFAYGNELYRSDGNSVEFIKDVNTGLSGAIFSFDTPFIEYLNQLYFTGDGGNSNVWRTNGSTLNQVTNINAGGDASPFSYASCNGPLYFIASNGSDQDIYYTDGTSTTRIPVPTLNYDASLTCFNNWIYFAADNTTNGYELWRTNGVTTEMVMDIRSGVNGSSPQYFNAIGSWLYFSANDGTNGTELWRTNGATTAMVSNINTGGSSNPGSSMAQLGNYVYFSAADATHGTELWRTNGTTTAMVMDIYTGASNSNPSEFTLFGGWLYFTADDGTHGTEVWRTNGTTTQILYDINLTGSSMFWGAGFKVLSNWLYFAASNAMGNFEPWRTNGTTTEMVSDVYSGTNGSMPSAYTAFNDYLYFTASHSYDGRELWRTNGSSTGIAYELTGSSYYDYMANFNDSLLFTDGSLLKKYFQVNSPTLTITDISSTTETVVMASSTVLDDGNSTSTAHGFVYSKTSASPTVASHDGILTVSSNFWTGNFSSSISGLTCNTLYYIRSYSTNLDSTGYGSTASFTTSACTCSSVAHAATYYAYPTCGPATCVSGYNVSGGQCVAISSGGGSGGVSIVVPATVPQVSNLILNAGDSKIDLSWTNPAGSSNFSGVKILRKMLSAPNSATDSTAVTIYTGAGNNFTDTGLINSQKYYYGVYSYNGANYSSAVTISGTPMFGIVINPNQATSTQVVNSTSSVPLANNNPNSLVGVQSVQAGEIIKSEVQEFMIDPQFVNLVGVEKTVYLKTIALGKADLADNNKKLIADFIHSGTPTTIILGAGERAGCVSSFSLAFGRLPESETDWQDVVKIANGRWPGQKNQVAEDSAKVNFKKVYGRNPNMSNQNDNAAVTVMAYGLRPANRNMNSEANSIKSFKYYFKRNPATAVEWDVVRAIAYSGAKR